MTPRHSALDFCLIENRHQVKDILQKKMIEVTTQNEGLRAANANINTWPILSYIIQINIFCLVQTRASYLKNLIYEVSLKKNT